MGMIHAGHLGDFAVGATVDLKFTTVDATGAPTAFDSGATVVVYQTNSTTETTTGVTLTEGFDGITGLHHVRITTVSDGSFFAAGRDFSVVVKTGTVDTVSQAGYVIGAFSISNRPVQGIGSGVITATSIATDAIGSAEISAAAANKIADHVRRRTQANVEASSDGDTLDVGSEYGHIQLGQESAISGAVLTVKKTDGSTTLGTKAVTVDPTTGNITGIS